MFWTRSYIHTVKDVDDNGSGFSVGRATDVRSSVALSTVLDDQHANQHSGLDLLRDDDASVCVRTHLLVVLVPVHAVWWFRSSGGVAHQLDRTVRLDVFGARHLDCCNTHEQRC